MMGTNSGHDKHPKPSIFVQSGRSCQWYYAAVHMIEILRAIYFEKYLLCTHLDDEHCFPLFESGSFSPHTPPPSPNKTLPSFDITCGYFNVYHAVML